MADASVAMHAADGIWIGRTARHDVFDEIAMAAEAVVLEDLAVGLLDHDRLVEVLEGEGFGMVIAIGGLGDVFLGEMRWDVAVVAGGEGMVWAFAPRVELVVHDVAVLTDLGVVEQISPAFGVLECETADTGENAGEDGQDQPTFRELPRQMHSFSPPSSFHKLIRGSL